MIDKAYMNVHHKNAVQRVGHQRHELKMLNRLLAWERQEHKAQMERWTANKQAVVEDNEALLESGLGMIRERRELQTKIDKLRTLASVAPDGLLDVRVVQAILDD